MNLSQYNDNETFRNHCLLLTVNIVQESYLHLSELSVDWCDAYPDPWDPCVTMGPVAMYGHTYTAAPH